METSTLIALSRQGGLRRQMDVIANNLANMNTAGFKGEKMMFVEHLVKSPGSDRKINAKLTFTRDIATMQDLSEGPIETTGNPLDVAISGDGYFTIQTEQGNRYTRNGRFKFDEGGQLVNQRGDPVLSDTGQPFFFGPEDTQINIARDGTVSTENGELGKIAVVRFENRHRLVPSASGLYSTNEVPTVLERPNLFQGALEGSNVLPIIEMTSMINTHRTYENVKSFIEREDERQKKMIDDLGETV